MSGFGLPGFALTFPKGIMNFSSTQTVSSKTWPGVTFTLRRIGPRKRAELEIACATARSKRRELFLQYSGAREHLQSLLKKDPELNALITKAEAEGRAITELDLPLTAEHVSAGVELHRLEEELRNNARTLIDPVFVKAALVSIDGISYNGDNALTADVLCEYGPDDLFEEIVSAINEGAYLNQELNANLSLPTTSGAPVDGEKSNTIAPNVSSEGTTVPATVPSISLNG